MTEALRNSRLKILGSKLPEGTAPTILEWIIELKVHFVISKPRKTKLGDFRVGRNGRAHRISVNADLNPYAFLITTVHEFAHLGCYLKHGHQVMPHGKEWKTIYTKMLTPFVENNVFPDDLTRALKKHLAKPTASSCSCPELNPVLALYDGVTGEELRKLTTGDTFAFQNIAYRYIKLRRTRVLCERLSDGRRYLISKMARVEYPIALTQSS